ncbi:TetR/AcrR family transcriptional regulator [Tenacibaculum sp. UWU-22]|uniref:TetR/AcrR family transcriptional regulator n=1 Tax=Tenacibaculum sp. UWU-22 TaxID=3234187 RepID=UPI0034DB4982
MRDKILEKSAELFLNLGFKSVTMDDIANEVGASKKTIYSLFKNKSDLILQVTDWVFCNITEGINTILTAQENPIKEIFDIKRHVSMCLNDEKSSSQYQLQKYYPKIYETIKNKQFNYMQNCVKKNLHRGVHLGLYRDNINVDFITNIYFNGMIGIKDCSLFPPEQFSINTLMDLYLEYHLRGICSEKGILELKNQLKNKNEKPITSVKI